MKFRKVGKFATEVHMVLWQIQEISHLIVLKIIKYLEFCNMMLDRITYTEGNFLWLTH